MNKIRIIEVKEGESMRPEWFKCENCLWCHKKAGGYYCVGSTHGYIDLDFYCSKWTCRNCWFGWNETVYEGNDMVMYPKSRPWHFLDHTKCQAAQIGIKENIEGGDSQDKE